MTNNLRILFETWKDAGREITELMARAHAPEVSQFQEHMHVSLDQEHHHALDRLGILDVLTVRDDGRLVGYHVAARMDNPHFHGVRGAFVLHYFLESAYRGHGVGSRMFRVAEQALVASGIECVWSGAKTHLPYARLYEHLGWTPVEMTYSKWIAAPPEGAAS